MAFKKIYEIRCEDGVTRRYSQVFSIKVYGYNPHLQEFTEQKYCRYVCPAGNKTDIFYDEDRRMFKEIPIIIPPLNHSQGDFGFVEGKIYDFKDFSFLTAREGNFLWKADKWITCGNPNLHSLEGHLVQLESTEIKKIDISFFIATFGNIIIIKDYSPDIVQIFRFVEDKIELLHELKMDTFEKVSVSYFTHQAFLHLSIVQTLGSKEKKTLFYFAEDGTELSLQPKP